MNPLLSIVLATLLAGFLSMALAALLAFRLSRHARAVLVSFAAGVMLSSAFLDILPEALAALPEATVQEAHEHAGHAFAHEIPAGHSHPHDHDSPVTRLFAVLLGGLFAFFALERFALWRHAHGEEEGHAPVPSHTHSHGHGHAHGIPTGFSNATLVLLGDAFHNFVDGFLIAAAFLVDPVLGITTTVAIVAHEIPQELGDFVLLLQAGFSRPKAFLANAASSLTAVAGGLIGYYFMSDAASILPYVLAIAAASFLYIALADLIPLLHQERHHFSRQFVLMMLGAGVVPLIGQWAH
jgi:zinc and cadmium transporter